MAPGKSVREYSPKVVLVHGTWGRRSSWSMPGSVLRRELTEALPGTELVRFEWSGRNRHLDRCAAAERLTLLLSGDVRAVIVIAHSHGGNVGAMALAGEALSGAAGHRRLICIGTPFISASTYSYNQDAHERALRLGTAQPWQRRSPVSLVRAAYAAAAVVVAAVLLNGLVQNNVEATYGFNAPLLERDQGLVPLVGWSRAVADSLLNGVVLWCIAIVSSSVMVTFVLAAVAGRRSTSAIFEHVSTSMSLETDVLVISTKGDEAALALRSFELLGRAAAFASQLLDRAFYGGGARNDGIGLLVISGVLVWGLPIAVIFALSNGVPLNRVDEVIAHFTISLVGRLGDELIVIVGVLAGITGLAMLILMLVVHVNILSIGVDGQRLSMLYRFSVSRRPLFVHKSQEVALVDKGRSVRHSRLLADSAAVEVIVDGASEH